jgi:hypothetical protein
MSCRHRRAVSVGPCSAFNGFRFPPEIIVLALRWYLRYGLSYRDVEELRAESGESRSITSACSGGCSASRPCSSTRLDRAAIPSGPVGAENSSGAPEQAFRAGD